MAAVAAPLVWDCIFVCFTSYLIFTVFLIHHLLQRRINRDEGRIPCRNSLHITRASLCIISMLVNHENISIMNTLLQH
ncbi:hypothetical protein BDW59DRAFT_90292 [Aspergillus cavernicola]|uniref:Uncharacterized protein n=1 Tax=Aspergillus cavernicola TaxID=176166 RepID=A0ABR4IAS2_9EURO